jgi:hypothetical protein
MAHFRGKMVKFMQRGRNLSRLGILPYHSSTKLDVRLPFNAVALLFGSIYTGAQHPSINAVSRESVRNWSYPKEPPTKRKHGTFDFTSYPHTFGCGWQWPCLGLACFVESSISCSPSAGIRLFRPSWGPSHDSLRTVWREVLVKH